MAPKTALVLGGGGARGAYEAGVVSYLREELDRELPHPAKLDVLVGTSVGAINVCHVAAGAQDPIAQARDMVARWHALRLEDVIRFGARDVLRFSRDLLGRPSPSRADGTALVDGRQLRSMVTRLLRWGDISRSMRVSAVDSLAVSVTDVSTGRTFVYVQRRGGGLPAWSNDPHIRPFEARIGPRYALASAAIPLVFPPVMLRGRLSVDGGLRLNVPISPALKLGADRVIVVSLRHRPSAPPTESVAYATAPFLIGKAMDALLLDGTDQDLERLRHFNAILAAGKQRYGDDFEQELNTTLAKQGELPMRTVRNILIRPSQDIGVLASEHIQSPEFGKRTTRLSGAVLRRLAEREGPDSADLVSYLLFDGAFAAKLVQLGREDARRQREEWLRFFS